MRKHKTELERRESVSEMSRDMAMEYYQNMLYAILNEIKNKIKREFKMWVYAPSPKSQISKTSLSSFLCETPFKTAI